MRIRQLYLILILCSIAACQPQIDAQTPIVIADDPAMLVAWTESGNLTVWQTGSDSPHTVAGGAVIQPFISPDAKHIAFTRGSSGLPESLWIAGIIESPEKQLAGYELTENYDRGSTIHELAWLDKDLIYFSTMRREGFNYMPQDDLFRVDVSKGETIRILAPSEGGTIHISPDRRHMALVYHGNYDQPDGRIRIIDTTSTPTPIDLLQFNGVASGAELPFYPEVFWGADSKRLMVAIPDPDLIYNDTSEAIPPTNLWEISLDPSVTPIVRGTVSTSIFGLPRWSDDLSQMSYMQRTPGTNTFTLMLADGTGTGTKPYLQSSIEQIQPPEWIPLSNRFIYSQGELGSIWLGSSGSEPERLSPEIVLNPVFVDQEHYVYVSTQTENPGSFEIKLARINGDSELITTTGNELPVYDVQLMPQN